MNDLISRLFDGHPMCVSDPNPILRFKGNGLRKPQKRTLEKNLIGKVFEDKISNLLKLRFPHAIVLTNCYYVTGRYYEAVCLYESVQIDIILVTDKCVYVIECKMLSSEVESLEVKSGTKNWRINMNDGRKVYHVNGCTQNRWHEDFVWALLQWKGIRVPIRRLTVVGGLSSDMFHIGPGCVYDHLVAETDLISTINKLESSINEEIDAVSVCKILHLYEWINPEREMLHYIFVKKKRSGLPASWKEITVPFN